MFKSIKEVNTFYYDFADKSKLGEDGIALLRTIIGACIDLFISLTKDCIKSIHLVENKKSNSCKLLQMKLAFSLEQMTSFAKLAYEIESFGDSDEIKPVLYTVLSNCTRCIQASLTDQEKQVMKANCIFEAIILLSCII